MKKIIFTNQKGGVGKTTLTRELGIVIAAGGGISGVKQVLLIDSDPQGNLTKSLTDTENPGLYEALEEGTFSPVEIRPGLSLLSGDLRLSALEKRYLGEVDAYGRLNALLQDERLKTFDLVLIDSPPSLGVMTLNGLAAADFFIIPLRPALYSLQGTNDLLYSVSKVKKSLNPALDLLGVVLNDYLPGPVISRKLKEEVEGAFGERVFHTVVSRTIKVEEAIAMRRGVSEEVLSSPHKISLELAALADEILYRVGRQSSGS